MSMLSEMAESPEVIRQVIEVNRDRIEQFVTSSDGKASHVLIAARGTSDNAARYAQYVWGARNRLSVGLAAPSLFGPYASAPSLTDALVVGMSQSGQSPDVVEVVREAARQGRPTVAFTNHLQSPLATAADLVIDLAAGEERSVAASKTYVAELAAVALWSESLSAASGIGTGRSEAAPLELTGIPELVEMVLADRRQVEEAVAGLVDHDRCVIVGRGFHHATAFEWALKLQELTYVLAQPFSAADLLHGPIALLQPGFPVLMVATGGPLLESMTDLARQLVDRRIHVVAITDEIGFPAEQRVVIPACDEWLSPLVAAPALQAFAHALALAKGLDPEQPRGLTKVTRTR
ncbi:MAG: SIS domain-containing protein [Acidimicrobiia bacterium]|nr:SIS domain-containing protein [Acidimicrobiia bacterium]